MHKALEMLRTLSFANCSLEQTYPRGMRNPTKGHSGSSANTWKYLVDSSQALHSSVYLSLFSIFVITNIAQNVAIPGMFATSGLPSPCSSDGALQCRRRTDRCLT